MITRKERVRRTLEVRVTEQEAEALTDVGIICVEKNGWPEPDKEWRAKLCAEERDELRFKRGVFGDRVAVSPQAPFEMAAKIRRVQNPLLRTAEERAAEILATKEWRGSEVGLDAIYDSRGRARPCVVLRHKSGAVCRLWKEEGL